MARFRPLLCKQTHLEDKFSYIARNSTHRGQIGSLGDRAPERTLPLWAARNTRTPTGTLPAPLILVDWFEELLGCKWPHYSSQTHTSGLVIQLPLGFRPDSSFSWQLCDITFGSQGIHGTLRVLVQIPKCWSRRSSLLSCLSQRCNSEFFDQRFTRKNGSLGECCSFVVGRLLPLSLRAHSSRLWSVSFSV